MQLDFITLSMIKSLANSSNIHIEFDFTPSKILIKLKKFDGRKIVKTKNIEYTNAQLQQITVDKISLIIMEFNTSIF